MVQRPFQLEQLVSAPLRALVVAQAMAAEESLRYFSSVGFSEADDKTGEQATRTVSFTFVQPVPDPARPGQVINTPVRVTAPLLALTSLPGIRIQEATVQLGMDIVETAPEAEEPKKFDAVRTLADIGVRKLRIAAVYAPPRPSVSGTAAAPAAPAASEPGLQFTIRVSGEPAGEGMARIQRLLQDAITATPVKEQ